MQILLVNGYEESAKGEASYHYVRSLIQQIYIDLQITDNNYTERRINELSDLVVDWEHDHLHQKAQECCQHFDKYDLIGIFGDMTTLPWEPIASQVVSLIHMIKFTKKPLIATGFGAFCSIYTMATRGVRFHVLNGPEGQVIESLPSYPQYSTGYGTFPSAWLDQETGDLYIYRKQEMMWKPICNVGMHFVASTGKPTSERVKQRPPVTSHTLSTTQAHHTPIAPSTTISNHIDSNEDDICITKPFYNSYLTQHLPASKHFTVRLYKNWFLNRNGSLPIHEQLLVVGEGHKGSNFFLKDHMLLLACRMEAYNNIKYCKQMIKNHIQHILHATINTQHGKIESSLYEFLFGEHGIGGGTYDTAADRMQYSPALSKQSVRTVLEDGPLKVDPPVMSMFYRPPKLYDVDYFALTAKRRCSSVGRRPKITVQNPMSARRKRLENAMLEVGMRDPGAMIEKIEQTINPYELEASMPEEAKDLFAGIVMKDNSITIRRQHVMRRISYLARNPPLEKRLDSGSSQNPPKSANQSSTIVEENSGDINEEDQDGEDPEGSMMEMDGVENPDVATAEGSGTRGGSNELSQEGSKKVKHVTIRPFTATTDASQPVTATNVMANTQPLNSKGVPTISDWMKVFEQSEEKQKDKTLSPRVIHQSLTERITRGDKAKSTTNAQAVTHSPRQPHSARSNASSSSKRSQQTPRSARHIVQKVVESYLPVNHPDATKFIPPQKNPESDEESEDDEDSSTTMRQKEPVIPDVVLLPIPTATPRSNYKEIVKQIEEKKESSLYEPLFREDYRTPQQVQLHHKIENKKKFIAGDFKTIFSPEHTALPLRKVGFVAACGPFPKNPGSGVPSNVPAKDWEYVRRLSTPDTWVAGSWK